MKNDAQKVFSLAAVVVAAILFGMILSGGLDVTRRVDADRPDPLPAATSEGMPLPDFATLAEHEGCPTIPFISSSAPATKIVAVSPKFDGRPAPASSSPRPVRSLPTTT